MELQGVSNPYIIHKCKPLSLLQYVQFSLIFLRVSYTLFTIILDPTVVRTGRIEILHAEIVSVVATTVVFVCGYSGD